MQCAYLQTFITPKIWAVIALLGLLVAIGGFQSVASAETPATNGTKSYCLAKLPQKAKSACQDDNLITKMRNAASYHCKKISIKKNKKESCITNKTKGYINNAKKNIDSAQEFKNKMNDVLKKDTQKTRGSVSSPSADANDSLSEGETSLFGGATAENVCGGGENEIRTSIDFGCKGEGNAMLDLAFAIIRFLSNGAGLVIIGSLVWAGIQYTGSRGDPQSSAMAINRIQSTVFALLIFIFAYAIINYLVPGVFLR